uniref:Uncharacterized protein n=1 Tax=Arundo donax TaxID=35708 RepID=A0A0A9HSR0_ARUDO
MLDSEHYLPDTLVCICIWLSEELVFHIILIQSFHNKNSCLDFAISPGKTASVICLCGICLAVLAL